MRGLPFFSQPLRQLLFGLTVGLPLLAACSSGSSGNDAVDAANALNEQKIAAADVTAKQEADAQFLVKTTSNVLLEVELGKLLQAKAVSPTIRSYGTQLVLDRLALLGTVRALAAAKKLAVPPALGEDEQEAYHETSTQAGAQLDKYAMALLVKTQKQDEDAFDDMSDDAYDGDIRGFAAKYHNSVQTQLDAAKEAADTAEKLP
jgi:putative membrane protein